MMTEIDRRTFAVLLTGLGIGAASTEAAAHAATPDGMAAAGSVEQIRLERNGWVPNNPHLPVLFYHRALAAGAGDPAAFEALSGRNGWPAQWRNGIYSYHHYHSTAHEVLGIIRGSAQLVLGGPAGRALTVEAGDVLVLPCGTGHCRVGASDDFLVVGAYPAGQDWDICRRAPTPAMVAHMAHLPFPASDPLGGPHGALVSAWHG